jgi:predicted O-methyltransferase YrrM
MLSPQSSQRKAAKNTKQVDLIEKLHHYQGSKARFSSCFVVYFRLKLNDFQKTYLPQLVKNLPFILLVFFVSLGFSLTADLRRRHLSLLQLARLGPLFALDIASTAAIFGMSASLAAQAVTLIFSARGGSFNSALLWGAVAFLVIGIFLWNEGKQQIRFQRPSGILFGECLVLCGGYLLVMTLIFPGALRPRPDVMAFRIACGMTVAVGGLLIGAIVPPFMKGFEGHRILEQVSSRGEFVQKEYAPPTPECPHPERWQMVDSQSAELEVLEFLKSLVLMVKPGLIVETGTFLGHSAIKIGEALKANRFGRLITIELDNAIYRKALERIEAAGLEQWVEARNESSLETQIPGEVDILFSDSHLPIREAEIRRFLPQIVPNGLVLVHDSSSHFQIVRDAVLKLEKEGLLSVVLFPTPRGLVVAQKRRDNN